MTNRQEVVNVELAEVLQSRGLVAVPEQIVHPAGRPVQLPDVVVDFQGLRLALEAEFISTSNAPHKAFKAALSRVERGIAHVGIAILYPDSLRTASFSSIRSLLAHCKFQFAIATEAADLQMNLFGEREHPEFNSGGLDDLTEALRRSYEQLVQDDTLNKAVELIDRGLGEMIAAVSTQPAATNRMAECLGIRNLPAASNRTYDALKQRSAVNRIAFLIISNAMVFQEVLSKGDPRVRSLKRFLEGDIAADLQSHWHFILTKINYHPIFFTAYGLIRSLSADAQIQSGLKSLIQITLAVVGWRASLRHDLAGRIFHRLLEEAKYVGAYYTSIPAATLLLKLALRRDRHDLRWDKLSEVEDFRLADLACGTGTLLMAGADVIADNYIRESIISDHHLDLMRLHHSLVEKIIYGYDVLASAVHLTASTLSLRVPETPINVTHLYGMPLGGPDIKLGTLEFLETPGATGTLFGLPEQIGGKGTVYTREVQIPMLDACVMNPPFTRSVGGNLLFGNLPEDERTPMQKRLKGVVSECKVQASITAGLGAVFAALGSMRLKKGGCLGLVLPRAALSGVAWEATRNMIEADYLLDYVITSHEPNHWNFSENTELSEVLLVARKRSDKPFDREKTVFVNLWKQPRNSIEALSVAKQLVEIAPPEIESDSQEIVVGETKCGEFFSVDWFEIRGHLWGFPCAFAQIELNQALRELRDGLLHFPGYGIVGAAELCKLGDLATLGFDCRDIHDGFDLAHGKSQYPSIWGHDNAEQTTMLQRPNQWLAARKRAAAGRPLRSAEALWQRASRLLIAERLWLNTTRLVSALATVPVVSNVWWPTLLNVRENTTECEKAISLWLNSTLGLLLLIGFREETRGGWVKFKKPLLHELPVLNVTQLSKEALTRLAKGFDDLALHDLEPLTRIDKDKVRAAIDWEIAKAINCPDPDILRELLAKEPNISLKSLVKEPSRERIPTHKRRTVATH